MFMQKVIEVVESLWFKMLSSPKQDAKLTQTIKQGQSPCLNVAFYISSKAIIEIVNSIWLQLTCTYLKERNGCLWLCLLRPLHFSLFSINKIPWGPQGDAMFPFTPSLVTAECPGWPLTQAGWLKSCPQDF